MACYEYSQLGGARRSLLGESPLQSHLEEADAIKLFHNAVDRGINSSDNSWDYNQGASDRRVGKALKGLSAEGFL